MVCDDAAVLGDDETVDVRNAGVSAIRVDVAGNDTHEGNFDYAVITVRKVPLPLTVSAKDKTYDGRPAEVAYSVDDAEYPAPYSGNVTLTYFRKNGKVRTQLESAPTKRGTYEVVATAADDRNYDGAVAETTFKISASSEPDDPDVPDDPKNPEDPKKPEDPTGPSSPDDPKKPEDPADPSRPVDPGDSKDRNDSDKPNASADAGGSSNSGGSVANSTIGSTSISGGSVTHATSTPRTADDMVEWPAAAIGALGLVVLVGSTCHMRGRKTNR